MNIVGRTYRLKNKRIHLADVSQDPEIDGDWYVAFKRLPKGGEKQRVVVTEVLLSNDAMACLCLLYLGALEGNSL